MGGQPAGDDSGGKPATDPTPGGAAPGPCQPPVGRAGPAARRLLAIVAGHQGATDEARAATGDPDPTVRSAAYGALGRLGRWDAPTAMAAVADPHPAVRRRGCELCGQMPGPAAVGELVPLAVTCLADGDPTVAEMAAWALGELVPAAVLPDQMDAVAPPPTEVLALVEVADHHPDALAREAAVAALGAIGHPAGLDAVLRALDGRPPLRRRAAVALAAFDDPDADAALARCLTDRDWQVREVAEELLGRGPTS